MTFYLSTTRWEKREWAAHHRSTLAGVAELSNSELDELIYEATVDCYGEDEQLSGFTDVIQNDLAVQFNSRG